MSENSPKFAWSHFIFMIFGLLGFAVALTLLYFSMRSVMSVGGYCAEGGPYQIEVHCPRGVAYLTPLSIFGLFVFGGMYFFNVVPQAFNFGYLFWSALFGSLGWNFLDYGIFQTGRIEVGWLICGIVFVLMALGPLFVLIVAADTIDFKKTDFFDQFFTKSILFVLQLIVIIIGVWIGNYMFMTLG